MNSLRDGLRAIRSLLFVPGDRPERVKKAASTNADAVVIDLEDAVASDRKDFARGAVARVLAGTDFGERSVGVRLNRLTTRAGLLDLHSLPEWPRRLDLLLLPKVESAAEIQIYGGFLTSAGFGGMPLLPIVESARGLRLTCEIASASPQVAGLLFGAGDLTADIGCQMAWEPLLAFRSIFVMGAAEAGVPAFDVPYLRLQDPEGLREESRRVRAMGFAGKTCIHPDQIAVVNEAFTPTPEEVAQAERIVAAARTQGTGVTVVDGRMVDEPVIRSAEVILRIAARSPRS